MIICISPYMYINVLFTGGDPLSKVFLNPAIFTYFSCFCKPSPYCIRLL